MKSRNILIASFAALFLASSCSDVNEPDEIVKANPGDEVVFGAALPATKTVYGEETSTGFPIYWVNGDKVRVASPQCLSGRNSAEYEVSVANTDQNYATSMTKTGDTGVQWGKAEKADFYSIYPSSASTALKVSGEGVTTTLHVDATQFASTKDNGTSYYAQPAEMGNVVMYAKTVDAPSGEPVALRYTPFSTVLEFEINAPSEPVADKQTEITIQSLTLTAPTGTTIAGDFGFTFPAGESTSPSIEVATGGSNAITMHFLDNNQYTTKLTTTKTTLKAKMCLMPISGNLAGWKIEVNTSAGTFSKTLTETDKDGKKTDLIAGQVHKIKLPTLNYASKEWVYTLASWIPTLPDYTNIYLSELSVPGAWYAGSDEAYQATSNITTLWNAGVRAFAVECRTNSSWPDGTPESLCISGTGRKPTLDDYYHNGTNITTVLDGIKTALASHQDEYAVLVLSYADGGDGGHRAEDHAYFLEGVANALSGYTDIVYSGPITKNTTIDDVKGKLIVKVNVDDNLTLGNYTAANALISYNPFLLQISNDAANFAHPYYSDLYWSGWADANKTCAQVNTLTGISADEASSKFIWVFSSANRTQVNTGTNKTIPTYKNRQDALGAMMTFSKTVYERSNHNVWFYFNCGGTQATSSTSKNPSPTTFASTMNSWLLNTINAKTDPSPLGIVMFNQCTGANATYHGADIIKAIIEMNSKFYLKHAGTAGGSTGGDATPTATNDATVWSGGKAI
ncbi:MAG: hypothetical protein SPF58_08590 [Candidatus Cryptobacteroides sp.]|uniref:hypothetical protein n=1 Tax=Candidatus Cryptobacteroides sp. TaxID=2952915 RepID=UPI002A9115EF|nr:hypothetical protein [Candidatus Cryptobacteroides sp.]MDY5567319.1 hypothetical protein [Candidatus Cryptobacteroides sp.]